VAEISAPGINGTVVGADILDTLLNLDAGGRPEMVATDSASYSDMVFGLFSLLGYNFSPRFRATRPPPTPTRRDEPQVCSAGGGIAVRGASPLREELVRPQRTTKGKGKEVVTHSLPLSTYSAPGGLPQDPGRAA
jgi:hypothetical protein